MLAVVMDRHGPPEVLVPREVPAPAPGRGQLLIDVELVNITFVETQIRKGPDLPETPEATLPATPGNGVGGRVIAAGPETDQSLVGERVVSSTGGTGAYAERVVVDAAAPLRVPNTLELAQAVALLADGRTAVMLVNEADLAAGDRVLVPAAAGGVGSLLVQLATGAGATVVAVAGGARKLAAARDVGAHHTVDYSNDDWAEDVRTITGSLDVVFDGVGGVVGEQAFDLLADGGRFVSFGLASGRWPDLDADTADERGVSVRRLRPTPETLRASTEQALKMGAAGRLHALIGQRFPLGEAAAAHRAIEERATLGKTLLTVQ